jgi:hypothetical protein
VKQPKTGVVPGIVAETALADKVAFLSALQCYLNERPEGVEARETHMSGSF